MNASGRNLKRGDLIYGSDGALVRNDRVALRVPRKKTILRRKAHILARETLPPGPLETPPSYPSFALPDLALALIHSPPHLIPYHASRFADGLIGVSRAEELCPSR